MTCESVTAAPAPAAVLADLDNQIVGWARKHTWDDTWEDTAQEGRIGALTALTRWSATHKVPVNAFCWQRAKGAMLDFYRREHGRTGRTPRPHVVSYDSDAVTASRCVDFAVTEQGYEAAETRTDIAQLVPHLTHMQREVVALTLCGNNLREVGELRGTTAAAACRALQNVVRISLNRRNAS